MANTELQQTFVRLDREIAQLEADALKIAQQIASKREARDLLKDHDPNQPALKTAPTSTTPKPAN